MEIVIIMGFPSAGKTRHAGSLTDAGYVRLNRDVEGGSLAQLHGKLGEVLEAWEGDAPGVVLDNTYPTRKTRRGVLEVAQAHGVPVRCLWLQTTIEEAQVNACERMIARHGKVLMPDEIRALKDANTYPPAPLFRHRKLFEKPDVSEGFAAIEKVPFARDPLPAQRYTGAALLLDYDGTLRETRSGEKYPSDPADVRILPRRREILQGHLDKGVQLFGVSNQSGVATGKMSLETCRACFDRTNELLGLDIPVSFCPHGARIECWCRKPMPGMAVQLIREHGLDPKRVTMVGDRTSDKTFARRSGIGFVHADEFFAATGRA